MKYTDTRETIVEILFPSYGVSDCCRTPHSVGSAAGCCIQKPHCCPGTSTACSLPKQLTGSLYL